MMRMYDQKYIIASNEYVLNHTYGLCIIFKSKRIPNILRGVLDTQK